MNATLTLNPTPGPLPTCSEQVLQALETKHLPTIHSLVSGHYLFRSAAAREEITIVVSMKRNVENSGIVVERLLSSVAMVNVLNVV